MATVLETLKGISAYPIPFRTLLEVVDRRGVNMLQEATQEVLMLTVLIPIPLQSRAMRLST